MIPFMLDQIRFRNSLFKLIDFISMKICNIFDMNELLINPPPPPPSNQINADRPVTAENLILSRMSSKNSLLGLDLSKNARLVCICLSYILTIILVSSWVLHLPLATGRFLFQKFR